MTSQMTRITDPMCIWTSSGIICLNMDRQPIATAGHYLSWNPEGSLPGCAGTWSCAGEVDAFSRNLEAPDRRWQLPGFWKLPVIC
jgi:hypothetical protein